MTLDFQNSTVILNSLPMNEIDVKHRHGTTIGCAFDKGSENAK
jgi:hypothetical protein